MLSPVPTPMVQPAVQQVAAPTQSFMLSPRTLQPAAQPLQSSQIYYIDSARTLVPGHQYKLMTLEDYNKMVASNSPRYQYVIPSTQETSVHTLSPAQSPPTECTCGDTCTCGHCKSRNAQKTTAKKIRLRTVAKAINQDLEDDYDQDTLVEAQSNINPNDLVHGKEDVELNAYKRRSVEYQQPLSGDDVS